MEIQGRIPEQAARDGKTKDLQSSGSTSISTSFAANFGFLCLHLAYFQVFTALPFSWSLEPLHICEPPDASETVTLCVT